MSEAIVGLWNFNDSGGSCGSSSSGSPPLDDDPPFEIPIPNKQPIKKIRNVRKSAIHKCAVCGDRPTGYHYDVLSCNGCKTFFRRTVINKRRFICSRGGNCEFTKDFRCACRACRFSKCVSAGMNPKAIQFPTTSFVEKEENDSDEHEQSSKDLSLVPMLKQIKTEEFDYMMALDTIIHRELAIQTLRGTKLPYSIQPDVPLDKLFERSCVIGSQTEPKSLPVEMYNVNPVRYWMVADLFLAVEFAKTFTDIQQMPLQDKLEMLYNVGGSIQIMSQSYYSACQQAEALTFPDGINAMHYQVYKNNQPQHELYFRECYCRPVQIIRQLQLTMPEFVMLKTIALFSCEAELGEKAQKAISEKREFLITVFRKYLLAQYGTQRGAEKLAICLLSIATFIEIAEKRRTHLHVVDLLNKCQISKLAKGIYLKQVVN